MNAASVSASKAIRTARSGDRLSAATVTGATSRSRNGFDKPPVTATRAASCTVSKASCRDASQPRVKRWLWNANDRNTFSQAEAAIIARQAASGMSKRNTKATNRTAAVCPATASQRSAIKVRRRVRPSADWADPSPSGARVKIASSKPSRSARLTSGRDRSLICVLCGSVTPSPLDRPTGGP